MLAGGGRRDSNLTYVRHVPKFLQSHAHLLGVKGGDEPALATKRPRDSSDSDAEDDKVRKRFCELGHGRLVCFPQPLCTAQEALRCAVAENPLLAQQYPELAAVVAKGEAAALKERGNAAFAAKRRALCSYKACSARAGCIDSRAAGTGTRTRPQLSQSALRWTPQTRSSSATVPRRSPRCGGTRTR